MWLMENSKSTITRKTLRKQEPDVLGKTIASTPYLPVAQIHGLLVDKESRCQHYHSPLDIVALKCYDCQKYYACYQCHDHIEDHRFRAYPCHIRQDKVVICGVCLHEMTIENYQKSVSCSHCHSRFNPACSKHYDIYFAK